MSNTPFDDIEDLALTMFRDYKIDSLYLNDIDNFRIYLDGFLMSSLPMFDNCVKNLEDFNLTKREFNFSLSLTEKVILAKFVTIQWLTREIQDITQLQNFLNDTDYKMYSNSQNLKAKSDYRSILREEINQDMVVYGLKNTNWTDWASGNFGI